MRGRARIGAMEGGFAFSCRLGRGPIQAAIKKYHKMSINGTDIYQDSILLTIGKPFFSNAKLVQNLTFTDILYPLCNNFQ